MDQRYHEKQWKNVSDLPKLLSICSTSLLFKENRVEFLFHYEKPKRGDGCPPMGGRDNMIALGTLNVLLSTPEEHLGLFLAEIEGI